MAWPFRHGQTRCNILTGAANIGNQHEHVVEAVERRLDANPWTMRARRNTVEHPFGTEMALHVLAYNLKRVMNILGIGPLIAAMRAAWGFIGFNLR